jgi:hypothetical protein
MASTTIRSTYSLDEETVRRLEVLARQWQVSKSEVLRRAIRAAASQPAAADRLGALDALQASVRLSDSRARSWMRNARRHRRDASAKRGR